jgi:hydroxyacylglutathione hydrolase
VNKEGPAILDGLHAPQRLPDDALAGIVSQGALVVDTRPATEFAAGHVPGTINIPLNASFTTWAGWLVPYTAALYLITDDLAPDRLTELVRALALIGLDTVRGVFAPSAVPYAAAHGTTLATIAPIDGPTLDARLASQEVTVVDVRGASEWATGHLPGALHVPLGYLAERAHEIPGDRPVVLQCQGGGRSAIAAALLQKLGRPVVFNLIGGFDAWEAAGLPVVRPEPTHA